MQGKYIITKNEKPILLTDAMYHNEIMPKNQIVSAGFFVYRNNKFKCFGESSSLDIKSREEDSDILNVFFGVIK